MTTIAFRDGIMATDSHVTFGDDFCTRCNKVFRLKYGHLAGFSGDADERDLLAILHTIRSEKNLPTRATLETLKQEFNVLLVLKNGRVFYVSCVLVDLQSDAIFSAQIIENEEKYGAVGNGFRYAIGAMAAGASARDAVVIACKYDIFTGPPVKTYNLKETKENERLVL